MSVEPLYRVVGARVALLRTKRGLTQTELGGRLTPPMTRAAISNMECGDQRIMLHVLTQIAKSLNTTVASLMRGL